jgi:hypothetical protein
MLGFHTLATTLQLSSRFQENGGGVGYLNRRSRWNWGVIGTAVSVQPRFPLEFTSGFRQIVFDWRLETRFVERVGCEPTD